MKRCVFVSLSFKKCRGEARVSPRSAVGVVCCGLPLSQCCMAPSLLRTTSSAPLLLSLLLLSARLSALSALTPVFSIPAAEVNGLQEPSIAKRLRGTPERIELENYRLSLQREEELEEVPEETLAEHNLSSVLDKATDADLGSR